MGEHIDCELEIIDYRGSLDPVTNQISEDVLIQIDFKGEDSGYMGRTFVDWKKLDLLLKSKNLIK